MYQSTHKILSQHKSVYKTTLKFHHLISQCISRPVVYQSNHKIFSPRKPVYKSTLKFEHNELLLQDQKLDSDENFSELDQLRQQSMERVWNWLVENSNILNQDNTRRYVFLQTQ